MFLNNTYKCKKSLVSKQYVDCKNWSVNTDSCTTICSLNVINNPSMMDCAKCTKRESYKIPEITESKEIAEPIEVTEEKTFIEKVKDYTKAETSQMFTGKVSQEIFEKRKSICMSCEHRVQKAKDKEDEIGWCKGGCGCTIGNPRAALSEKLYMPTLSCPKKKFGPEKGVGFNVSDALNSIKGLATAVKSNLE